MLRTFCLAKASSKTLFCFPFFIFNTLFHKELKHRPLDGLVFTGFFVLGFFTQHSFALPAPGAAKQGLWELKAATPEATPHSAAVPVFPTAFCLHICGA